ncbi:ATP-binding protein [Erythrobacter sp. BLCC-B19]|uniref:ATP-binding protein n=1 Tax=Erythrobacter sp. BLCC-B19 TaxID=3025315 RepID=UPI00235F4C2B|nr:ATP-binding protein [Erythrobacter sp. BLCC-B19]WDA40282.1 ATP-binding protein [Erythrobacter sp. BLCC-B19]
MLYGFDISRFRNFGSEPDLVGPLGKINVFIGANNSGKSNILRYVRDFLVPTLNVQRGSPPSLSAVNRPLLYDGEATHFSLLVPLEEGFLVNRFPFSRPFQKDEMLSFFRSLPNCIGGEYLRISLTVSADSGRKVFVPNQDLSEIDANQAQAIAHSINKNRGSLSDIMAEVFSAIYENYKLQSETKYVPAFRQVKTKLREFSSEYETLTGSDHITNDLIKFSNPTYENQDQKKIFAKLTHFIREITQISDLEIEIPHDLSTINVSANGILRPLEALGSGVHELFMLAAEIILNQGKIVLLEEPETHLHPEFQRKLMHFLTNEVDGQFFITTHSPVIIDTPNAKVFGVSAIDGSARVYPLLTNQERRQACRELGYRASDLLQSNCIVWVEGPSDRIYLKHWITQKDPSLREGIEYSIMFYGGRLLSHLTVDDDQVNDFIQLLPINRSVAILIDSDLGAAGQSLRTTKTRVESEVNRIGGYSWVTDGREIENYVSYDIREMAVKEVHRNCDRLSGARHKFGKPLEYRKTDGKVQADGFDKLAIAKAVTKNPVDWSVLDLDQRVTALVNFIRSQN